MAKVKIFRYFLAVLFIYSEVTFADPACEQLQQAWGRRFSREFTTPWNNQSLICNSNDPQYAFALALLDLNRELINDRFDADQSQLFAKVRASTDGFRMATSATNCTNVLASYFNRQVTFCPEYFKQAREVRASVMVHESRHGYRDDPKHVRCVSGLYQETEESGTKNCDAKFYDGAWFGSGYNAEVYFYGLNIFKRSPKNSLSEATMRSYLRVTVPDRFVDVDSGQVKKWRQ